MTQSRLTKIFRVYERFRNKTVWVLLRPKADNILSGLDLVMTDCINVASRVLLNNGGTNLNEDVESLRGCT